MGRKKEEEASSGAPAWMATYGDMVTLLLCFFVLLFSMSSVDVAKFKAAMSSFADQIDVMPGGETLTEGELLNNGISQLAERQIILSGGMPISTDEKDTDTSPLSPEGEDEDKGKDDQDEDEAVEPDPYELAGKIAMEFEELLKEEGLETSISISLTSNYVKFTLAGEFLFDSGKADLKAEAVDAISVITERLRTEEYVEYDIEIEGHTDNRAINSGQFPNNWILSSYRAYAVLEELTENHGFSPKKVAATGYGEHRPIADNETIEGRAQNRRVEVKVLLETEEVTLDEIRVEDLEEGLKEDEETEPSSDAINDAEDNNTSDGDNSENTEEESGN